MLITDVVSFFFGRKYTMEAKIKGLIKEGEGQTCEFKLATEELPKNLFETVCAFFKYNWWIYHFRPQR